MSNDLQTAIETMRMAKASYDAARDAVWPALLSDHPEVRDILREWGMDEDSASRWFCSPHFDGGTRTAAELFAEGRGDDVRMQIAQIVHGVYR